jgi:hypothetical protein
MLGTESARRQWLSRAARALLAAAALPAALHAQACPLCYQSAASASSQFIAALKNGIFVLIVPSFLICAAVTYVTYRKRNICDEDEFPMGE